MDVAVATVVGLSLGVLTSFNSVPRTRWIPLVATWVILAAAGTVVLVHFPSWGVGLGLGVGVCAGVPLAGGITWADHPLLAGRGYWSRVRLVFLHAAYLIRVYEQVELERGADTVSVD